MMKWEVFTVPNYTVMENIDVYLYVKWTMNLPLSRLHTYRVCVTNIDIGFFLQLHCKCMNCNSYYIYLYIFTLLSKDLDRFQTLRNRYCRGIKGLCWKYHCLSSRGLDWNWGAFNTADVTTGCPRMFGATDVATWCLGAPYITDICRGCLCVLGMTDATQGARVHLKWLMHFWIPVYI